MSIRRTDWDGVVWGGVIALLVLGLFAGMAHSEYRETQVARTCIEQGFEWIDDSCIKGKR